MTSGVGVGVGVGFSTRAGVEVATGEAEGDETAGAAEVDAAETAGMPPQADRLRPSMAIRPRADKDLLYFIVETPQIYTGAHEAYGA